MIHQAITESIRIARRHSLRWVVLAGSALMFGMMSPTNPVPVFAQEHRHHNHQQQDHQQNKESRRIKEWTCSMHPQIRSPKPGKCPICGMDLVPVYEETHEAQKEEAETVMIRLNETAKRLAGIRTETVRRILATRTLRLIGELDYDETRLAYITAWVPGRLDRLYVDFTGTRVKKGDHLVEIYSPELIAAQQELIEALRQIEKSRNSALAVMRETAEATLKSARDKLRLLGLTPDQIAAIETSGRPQEHVTIHSPLSGVVIDKSGFEGQYVKTGDRIYTVADLTRLWLFLEAYETDLPWVHYGQHVVVTTEAFPGKVFHGRVAFIDPALDPKTRTVKVRVNVDNPDLQLKPGLFARALVHATLAADGLVYEPDLAGKWICPMHPEVIKDQPGVCDLCGMNLVSTEEYGFRTAPVKEAGFLVIPKTAPLITGRRAVVYVAKESTEGPDLYEGREVVLGPLTDEGYVVFAGLKEGEKVVVRGQFAIDSAAQIQAKPSMMNPAGYYNETDNLIEQGMASTFSRVEWVQRILKVYFDWSDHMQERDAAGINKAVDALIEILDQASIQAALDPLARSDAAMFTQLKQALSGPETVLAEQGALAFARWTKKLQQLLDAMNYREDRTLYVFSCPEASKDETALWIQDHPHPVNPYAAWTKTDPGCGQVLKTYERRIVETQAPTGHQHGQH